ncbi:MAG: hypothetical protein ACRC33_08650, partial [Gemmataceae bacterium]
FGKDVEGARLRQAKADVTRLRSGLLDDLDQTQTAGLIQALNSKALGASGEMLARLSGPLKGADLKGSAESVRMPATPIDPKAFATPLGELAATLTKLGEDKATPAEKAKAYKADAAALVDAVKTLPDVKPLPAAAPDETQAWADWGTRWGLTVIGACLLAGLLTRINCWLAALFLLMTYLAVPSLPWLPVAGPQEGNYVFVNKNVVEMFALCVLGTLPTGRWFGADGLLYAFWRFLTGTVDSEEG